MEDLPRYVKRATIDDLPEMVDLTVSFLDERIVPEFAHVVVDREYLQLSIAGILKAPYIGVFVLYVGTEPVGVILGTCAPEWFSPTKAVNEMFYGLLPAYRTLRFAIILMNALKEWGEEEGAERINMGCTSGYQYERVSKLYERMGYRQIGAQFTKEI